MKEYRHIHFFSISIKKILTIAGVVLFILCDGVQASTFSIEVPESVSSGEQIAVTVLIDPEGAQINSIESTLVFSPDVLKYNGFSATQSSIPLWVEKPELEKEGEVHFSGVIPGGLERLYDPLNTERKAIPLVQLFFITKKSGTTTLSFSTASALKNDGRGTPTLVTLTPATLLIKERDNGEMSVPQLDTIPPEPFTVEIIERSLFGKTPRLAVFSAVDKEGSISHYEVAVGGLAFEKTESPFPLPYKLFPYQITVRAVDYAGNVRDQHVTIPAEGSKNIAISILIGVLLLTLIGFLRYRFYNRKNL